MGASSSKGPAITAQDRAVLDLKLQRDKVKQYRKKAQHSADAASPPAQLQYVLDAEHSAARAALARGDKERARTALRRRKWQEGMIAKTDTQLETLEGLVSTIEFAQIEVSVMHGLKQGNAVLKEIHKELNPESVERLMSETADAVAYQKEIDEMLSSRMTAEEEEEVADELAALEAEARRERGEAEPVVQLPDAPTTEPVRQPQRVPAHEEEEQEERVAIAA
ncbi:hypothetical protein FA09DRAFT_293536 [Tilletiopsis washingtonensis]|uniref:Snf7-domain-containing protein n=1 Tax=Tilletiopsis washingtonensis TaxID=58919 RepID=A0A316ZHV1_9BASI|nr:hypothetical protein FA09DRAFT_293536 [Tilletiopsis washingtonensis]PWO00847.1 hypothetical protein FA09DRAFT_293536 [Tilletiopsis washingtonensis]